MTILVTGATGNVGRHIVDQLVHSGQRGRARSRNPANANFPEGVGSYRRTSAGAHAEKGSSGRCHRFRPRLACK
ncbi:NAD-dependent epimerase/dehydratase family protein [Paenibacillus allorhizosphaerae]|uniref:NAD-dependent epimerase/dehydratase domain-containing protein n=1 Tax=Paenibacillus allorhizosphaerae TaxID=2849866 RepID=A0ABM8VA99_9BACL|nr:hypothetical protein PAECIP111802_00205 [Paenibacillus allorhizosphaerae]